MSVTNTNVSEIVPRAKVPMAWAAQTLAAMCERIDNGEAPAEALIAEFKTAEFGLAESVDRRIAFIRFVEGSVEGAKAARDAYAAEAQRLTELLAAMKERTKEVVEAFPDQPFKGTLGRFAIQKNGGLTPLKLTFGDREVTREVIDMFEVDARFVGSKVVYWINTNEVRRILEAGEKLPWAELEDRGTHLRIRA